jgi:hypothetical protein
MSGLTFQVNENHVKIESKPILAEVLFFWTTWKYKEQIEVDSIKSVCVKQRMGIPTLEIKLSNSKKSVLSFSLARASYEDYQILRSLNNRNDVKNEIQFQKYLSSKGLPSVWKNPILVEEKLSETQLALNF